MNAATVLDPLRAELRKVTSTKLWWGLGIPVVALAMMIGAFGGAFTSAFPEISDVPLLLGSLAYALGTTTVFAAVHGVICSAGEHRHRTITATYLSTPNRTVVMATKMAVSAAVGAVYALATVLFGGIAGLAADSGVNGPGTPALLATTAIGVAVCALWGALGAAFGTLLSNQVSALVSLLIWLMLGEFLIGVLLSTSESEPVRSLSSLLPGNAGEVAIYWIPAVQIAGRSLAPQAIEIIAGVGSPPSWWVALLTLACWTALTSLAGWFAAATRDIT